LRPIRYLVWQQLMRLNLEQTELHRE
jgi:hypothetical protein